MTEMLSEMLPSNDPSHALSMPPAGSTHSSYKVEVIADDSGQWATNGLHFATVAEAAAYGADLYSRWTSVRTWRVAPSPDAVTPR